ncbi:uncharacterized protein RAG0_09294 [Rhynchosporium agropyri]|uniref:Uncharacterized protein n=1 Tax=Rhynchosporium agropyri TaxID=914238 RepID=A0A1E1KUT4_9HELO|nr:uncharacterized protein RAG0_09294 [Rhynchosporium agropyri]
MTTPKAILAVSASFHLSGHLIPSILTKRNESPVLASPEVAARFENVGYQVDPNDPSNALAGLFKGGRGGGDFTIFLMVFKGHVEINKFLDKLVQGCA